MGPTTKRLYRGGVAREVFQLGATTQQIDGSRARAARCPIRSTPAQGTIRRRCRSAARRSKQAICVGEIACAVSGAEAADERTCGARRGLVHRGRGRAGRLDADFYGAGLKWLPLVEQDAVRYGWVGVLDGEPVGFVDVEIDGERAGIAIYVRSEFRRRGIGEQLLRLAVSEGRSLGVAELVGGVEDDNVASIRCLIAAGFTPAGADEFGPSSDFGCWTHNCSACAAFCAARLAGGGRSGWAICLAWPGSVTAEWCWPRDWCS